MRVLTAAATGLTAVLIATCVPAVADAPGVEVKPGQAFVFPSSVEFDWSVENAAEGTRITVLYVGCGDQVAGYGSMTGAGDYAFTAHGNPSKLGPEWTRTLVIEREGSDPYIETEANTSQDLRFVCSDREEPVVAAWSHKQGRIKSNPRPGDKLAVSPTTLNSFGEAKDGSVSYRWSVNGVLVGSRRILTVKKTWVGQSIAVVAVAATTLDVWRQVKRLNYGKVQNAK